jgi:hypothetical protein
MDELSNKRKVVKEIDFNQLGRPEQSLDSNVIQMRKDMGSTPQGSSKNKNNLLMKLGNIN